MKYLLGTALSLTMAFGANTAIAACIASFVYKDIRPLAGNHKRSLSAAAVGDNSGSVELRHRPWAIISVFFHRDTIDTLFEAGKLTVTLLFVIANALILKHVLTDYSYLRTLYIDVFT